MFLFITLSIAQNVSNIITNTSQVYDDDDYYFANITNTSNTTHHDDNDDHEDDTGGLILTIIFICCICIPVASCFLAMICNCISHCWFDICECEHNCRCCSFASTIQIKRKQRVVLHNPKIFPKDARYLNQDNCEKELYNDEVPDCIICLEPVKKKSTSSVTLDCGHRFHRKCINNWIKTQYDSRLVIACPTCKQTFRTKQPSPSPTPEPVWYPYSSSDEEY
jgi:hypothetical protein